MTMRCADVEKFVHPYIDGEFEEAERGQLERHLTDCPACRNLVSFQSSFKANLRARLRRPTAPAELQAKILAALDRADRAGEGPSRPLWRRMTPALATLAAAAAVVLVFGDFKAAVADDDAIVDDAVRYHQRNLPPEVMGEDAVRKFFPGKVTISVRPPHLRAPGAELVGGRISHLQSRDAAQLMYRVHGQSLTVYVYDATGMAARGHQTRNVRNHEVHVSQRRGYNVIYYVDHDVGYAFTSDLDPDEMIRLVSTSLE